MKLKGNETIANEVGTYIGTLTWIDWEHNRGRVTLDPKPDADPAAEPVEVECAFRYAGQHWIWNMDAYPEEDIASHSAFAFCMGDRVMLLHPVPATAEDPERPKYVAVAILKEEDDGQGGKTVTLEKRKVWPLYRLGHRALVLNFKYSGLGGKGAGFPFVSDDGRREYQNPFTDQQGHTRAFGTPERDGGSGNPRLVVTREEVIVRPYGRQTRFVPHAIHEFCEAHENIPYVPDVLMQTTPNWRGRIIGWSAEDEILIDNIPVAKVTGAADIEAIVPSWKAVTRKFIHINEAANILTVLYVTMDCNFDWRPREKSGNPNGGEAVFWYPPQYAFYTQSGSARLDELCVYAAMETPREELPVIALQEDAAASWKWQDLQRQEPNFILHNQPDIADGVDIAFPGREAEMSFWGGVAMRGDGIAGQRRKISLVFACEADGALRVEKRIGDLEPFAPFNEDNLEAYVTYAERTVTTTSGTRRERYINRDYARLKSPVGDTAARLGDTSLYVEVSGLDDYRVSASGQAWYDTDLTKRYRHVGPPGDFTIAEERQSLQGSHPAWDENGNAITSDSLDLPADNVRATISMIIFTHIDLRHGIYGYWEVIWLDDVRVRDILPIGGSDTGKTVQWHHYVRSANYKIKTHQFAVDIPYGSGNDNNVIRNLAPITRLVRYSHLNNPGVPGFAPEAHYVHNIWNLPRFEIDGVKLEPSMSVHSLNYKMHQFYPEYYSRAMENDIYLWLQGTTPTHGTKRASGTFIKSPVYNFTLCPLPSKEIGVWPWYKNVCMGYPGDFAVSSGHMDSNRMLAGILFSESMEFTGVNYDGEFSYLVKIRAPAGMEAYPMQCDSAGFANLRTCTGRTDAVISAD